jgi:hypothetical protein
LHHYSYHECPTPGCRGLMTRLHIVLNGIHINHPEPFGFDGETAIMDPSQFYEKRQAYIVLTEYILKDPIYIPTL